MPGANRYTTTEFLTSIRTKGHIPSTQDPYTDAKLLALANEELMAIERMCKSVRENYYVASFDYAINSSGVYPIHTRATGAGLTDLWLVNGTQIFNIARSELNEQFSSNTSPTGYYSYYLQGNNVIIRPSVTSGLLRQWVQLRPNYLVATSAAAQITAINTSTSTLTFASVPSTFTTSVLFDCINDQPHFDWRFIDYTPTAVTSTTVQFSSLPTDAAGNYTIQVGDWLALAGQTPVPQILVEFFPILVQRTLIRYCLSQGLLEKVKAEREILKEQEAIVIGLINPRVADEPKRIVPDSNVIGGYRRWRAWRAT